VLLLLFLTLAALLGFGAGFVSSRGFWRSNLICEIERRLAALDRQEAAEC
jgi:hypothetical protein